MCKKRNNYYCNIIEDCDKREYKKQKEIYLSKSTKDLKMFRNILEGKKSEFESKFQHDQVIYSSLTILAAIISIMYGGIGNDNVSAFLIKSFVVALFTVAVIYIFRTENNSSRKNQKKKEECIVRIGIINEILEEREKAELNNKDIVEQTSHDTDLKENVLLNIENKKIKISIKKK